MPLPLPPPPPLSPAEPPRRTPGVQALTLLFTDIIVPKQTSLSLTRRIVFFVCLKLWGNVRKHVEKNIFLEMSSHQHVNIEYERKCCNNESKNKKAWTYDYKKVVTWNREHGHMKKKFQLKGDRATNDHRISVQ